LEDGNNGSNLEAMGIFVKGRPLTFEDYQEILSMSWELLVK
jgi:hypothetical protein